MDELGGFVRDLLVTVVTLLSLSLRARKEKNHAIKARVDK